jgi:gliding motility-associated-like protein
MYYPARLKPGEDLRIAIRIKNQGLRMTADYTVAIFEDRNLDNLPDPAELLVVLPGAAVAGGDSAILNHTYVKPAAGAHRLVFKIDYSPDKDPADNQVIKDFTVSDQTGILTVSPEIFTPNADNVKDILQIDYRLPEPGGELTIAVYDCRGRKVHLICSRQTAIMSQGTMVWNGNSQGRKIPTGMYVIYLEYQYRNRLIRAKQTAVLAR